MQILTCAMHANILQDKHEADDNQWFVFNWKWVFLNKIY